MEQMTKQEMVLEHIRQNPGILRDDFLYDMSFKMTRKEASENLTRAIAQGRVNKESSGKYNASRHPIPHLYIAEEVSWIQNFMFAFVRECVYDTHNRQGA